MEAEMTRKSFTKEELGIPFPFSELAKRGFSFQTTREVVRGTIIGSSMQNGRCVLYVSVPYALDSEDKFRKLHFLFFDGDLEWCLSLDGRDLGEHNVTISGKLHITT